MRRNHSYGCPACSSKKTVWLSGALKLAKGEEVEKSRRIKDDSDEIIRVKNIVRKAVISLEAIFEELSDLERLK